MTNIKLRLTVNERVIYDQRLANYYYSFTPASASRKIEH